MKEHMDRIMLPVAHAHVPMQEDWDCGQGTMATAVTMIGRSDIKTRELTDLLGSTPEYGTSVAHLDGFMERHRISHTVREHTTLTDIAAGLLRGWAHIVAYQTVDEAPQEGPHGTIIWDSSAITPVSDTLLDGHYAIIIGMDRQRVFAIDPASYYAVTGLPVGLQPIPKDVFLARWIDEECGKGILERWSMSFPVIRPTRAKWAKNYIRRITSLPKHLSPEDEVRF